MEYFDASKIQPSQGGTKHPVGMFDFQITNTSATPTKDHSGGMLVVEFTSPVGTIVNRYNLWNASPQAVEIAQKELSALCHATGIFKLSFPANPDGSPDQNNAARELRGGRGRMQIGFQKGHQPTPENPEGGYVEVQRVFDAQGNEPGKAPAQQQQPQQQAPMQQQQTGGWGNPAPTGAPSNVAPAQQVAPVQTQPWAQNVQPTNQPAPQQPQQAGGWGAPQQQANPSAPSAPPWARG